MPVPRPVRQQQPGFLDLIVFFLRAEHSVWIGALLAAVAVVLIAAEVNRVGGLIASGVVLMVTALIVAVVDRRRIPGRRTLVRGRRLSPRRFVALLVTLVLATAALALGINLARRAYDGVVAGIQRLP